MSDSLPAIATRGRQFAIARLTRVDPQAEIIIGRPLGNILAEACKAATAIDWRLSPTIVLIDRPSESEVDRAA